MRPGFLAYTVGDPPEIWRMRAKLDTWITPLFIYRLACLIGPLVLYVDGVMTARRLQLPDYVLELRILAISALLCVLVSTFVSGFARRHVALLTSGGVAVMLFYSAAHVYAADLGVDEVMGGILLLCMSSVVFHRSTLIIANLAIGTTMFLAFASQIENPIVSFDKFALSLVAFSAFFMVLMIANLQARKRREQSEEAANAWFDNSADALIYGDVLSAVARRVNLKAYALFQTEDPTTVINLIIDGVLRRDQSDSREQLLKEAAETEVIEDVIEFDTAQGGRFFGALSLRGICIDGESLTLVRITDVTARTAYEAALEDARAHAERAMLTRTRFLANMSHEIRTPMNGVIGMTSLLLDSELDDQQRSYLETIRSSGESLLAIINQILDFSKIDADQIELEEQAFSVENCAAEALDMVAPIATDKGLELHFAMAGDVPAEVRGDVTRVRQVLVNLLSNAVKFTSVGSATLRVASRNHADHVELQFDVTDTGVGIGKDKITSLFDAFAQADASTTRQYGGTGLGLSISRRLATLMAGDIVVASAPGQGSTFTFTMRADCDAPGTACLGAHASAGRRVLIFDTEDSVDVYAPMLQHGGATVDSAARLSDVCRAIATVDYDVLVVALHGAHREPGPLLRAFTEATECLPATVLLTRFDSGMVDVAGFDQVLRKPVKPGDLLRTVFDPGTGTDNDPVAAGSRLPGLPIAGHSFLIAEDNPVNQQVARQMLMKLGIQADVVSNGKEAVEMLEQRRYDVVFMDVQMPEIDGLEASTLIRQLAQDRQPYIIAMTANAMSGDREQCLAAGMDDFISKPVRMPDLHRALTRALAHDATV